MRILTLISADVLKPVNPEIELRETNDEWPRITSYEKELNSFLLDRRYLKGLRGTYALMRSVTPAWLAQVVLAYRMRGSYDAVVSWAEHLGLPFAALLKLTGRRIPHVVIFSWISPWKKAVLLKNLSEQIDRVILMSSMQHDFALRKLNLSPSQVVLLRWPVDQKFWHPMEAPQKGICAVGREMRDYRTLVRALKGTDIPCHIAAAGLVSTARDRWRRDLEREKPLPPTITLGARDYRGLRELYASSRFVVVPLYPTDTDNGTTTILEAMAMGKAVICSKVDGQRDVIQDGTTGIFVEPENPQKLREAIEYLWNNPEVACRMGRAGRSWVEKNHTLDSWLVNVRSVVESAVTEYRNGKRRK